MFEYTESTESTESTKLDRQPNQTILIIGENNAGRWDLHEIVDPEHATGKKREKPLTKTISHRDDNSLITFQRCKITGHELHRLPAEDADSPVSHVLYCLVPGTDNATINQNIQALSARYPNTTITLVVTGFELNEAVAAQYQLLRDQYPPKIKVETLTWQMLVNPQEKATLIADWETHLFKTAMPDPEALITKLLLQPTEKKGITPLNETPYADYLNAIIGAAAIIAVLGITFYAVGQCVGLMPLAFVGLGMIISEFAVVLPAALVCCGFACAETNQEEPDADLNEELGM